MHAIMEMNKNLEPESTVEKVLMHCHSLVFQKCSFIVNKFPLKPFESGQ